MDKNQRAEYQEIDSRAEWNETFATKLLADGDPRAAQVHATLAVATRLEALSYAVRHTTTAGTESARANSTKGEQL